MGPAPPARSRRAWSGLIVLILMAGVGCDTTDPVDCGGAAADAVDYRAEMRGFVQEVAAYARARRPGFVVVSRNGLPLLTENGEPDGPFVPGYVGALSGAVRDGVHHNLSADGSPADPVPVTELTGYLDRLVAAGTPVLATSYCRDPADIDDAYLRSAACGYLAFVAPGTACDSVPAHPATPPGAHAGDVDQLTDARNFLQLLSPGSSAGRENYLARLTATDHDILVVDACQGSVMLTVAELDGLRTKSGGGRRLVLASLCIGAAETHRDYWQEEWGTEPPSWLEPADPVRPGVRTVRYWDPGWSDIILGHPEARLDRIIAAGFDGVLLDRLDAYEHFEDSYG